MRIAWLRSSLAISENPKTSQHVQPCSKNWSEQFLIQSSGDQQFQGLRSDVAYQYCWIKPSKWPAIQNGCHQGNWISPLSPGVTLMVDRSGLECQVCNSLDMKSIPLCFQNHGQGPLLSILPFLSRRILELERTSVVKHICVSELEPKTQFYDLVNSPIIVCICKIGKMPSSL